MQPTDHYTCLLITHRQSAIVNPGDLRGRSFAFTDRESTSGFVYPSLMLKKAGIDPEKDFSITFFLEKHDKVCDSVASRSIDAGSVSSTAMEGAILRNGDLFRVIAESAPIPRNAVVSSPHLPEELRARIQEVLSVASTHPIFTESPSILRGFTIKDDSFYDIVREARKRSQ
jgi:phosphonate transport system substrate-binding protein